MNNWTIVLKNPATGLYLKNGVSYTRDPALAMSFDSVNRAQRFCITHRVAEIVVALAGLSNCHAEPEDKAA